LEKVTHDSIQPIYDKNSEILILGSIPSPKSREYGFYYGHPQNKFWRVMSEVYGEQLPESIEAKKEFLYRNKIALWDVLESCYIHGADDSSIREAKANDIRKILKKTNIKSIYTTGRKAYELYNRLCFPATGIEAILLASTSPANCKVKYNELLKEYQEKLFLMKDNKV